MRRISYGIVTLLFLIAVGLTPAGASVTKITYVDIVTVENFSMSIAPEIVANCDYQMTSNVTQWMNPAIEIRYWKVEYSVTTEGVCEDGTRFKCIRRFTVNEQFTYGSRATVRSENCWFHYPDGSTAKQLGQFTYANGEFRVDISGKWN